MTDTDGRLLTVRVQPGGLQDRDGTKPVLRGSRAQLPFVRTVFADGGYTGRLVAWARTEANVALTIVRRPRGLHRFEPLPRRWAEQPKVSRAVRVEWLRRGSSAASAG